MELNNFKKEYGKLWNKYKLPLFRDLNVDFEIDKLDKESDNLLRAIRKIMMEKIVNSMGFLEMLLNPVNAPRMYINYIRSMGVEDKEKIDKIYGILADLSMMSLALEINSDEKAEAELIKNVFSAWNKMKEDFGAILNNMKKPRNNNSGRKDRSYFG